MTDEETRNSQYWEERSEELSNDELKGVSGGLVGNPYPSPIDFKPGVKGKGPKKRGLLEDKEVGPDIDMND